MNNCKNKSYITQGNGWNSNKFIFYFQFNELTILWSFDKNRPTLSTGELTNKSFEIGH